MNLGQTPVTDVLVTDYLMIRAFGSFGRFKYRTSKITTYDTVIVSLSRRGDSTHQASWNIGEGFFELGRVGFGGPTTHDETFNTVNRQVSAG